MGQETTSANYISFGDQRHIFIQLIVNKRRKRRRGKGETPHTMTLQDRVNYVLKNGKIIDY